MKKGILPVILAAGRASRFNGEKLNRDCAGRALASWVVTALEKGDSGHGVIVAREESPVFASEFPGWDVIVNDRPDDGMALSIKLAAERAEVQGAGGILIVLADMPFIPSTHYSDLMRLVLSGASIAATRYPDGKAGVPACFSSEYFADLMTLNGDEGAAHLLTSVKDIATRTANPDWLVDVDTVEDLRRAAALLRRREDQP